MGLLLFQIFTGLILLSFCLAGISQVVQSYKDLRTGIGSRKWNPLEAVVTDHTVYTYMAGQSSTTVYGYSVVYNYSVEHQTYQGFGFDHGGFVERELAEQASIADYPVGKAVEIFFDSGNPEISSSKTSSEQITSALFVLCLCVGWASVFTGMIVRSVTGSVTMPFLQIGVSIITIVFWCWMLIIISSTLVDCFKKVKNRRLPRPGLGFLIILFLFGILSTHLMVGVVLIGSTPAEGCYQPNFQEKRWISVSCPSPSNGQN
jgi:hypothetical protein